MTAANPYFIYIDLFLADGVTRPNQNQIARVQAFDVNGTVVTDEGQSGFDQSTGGWMPVFMQNIAAFSPPRDQPNLKFEVFDTTNALVYTTQVFTAIPSGSTVKIVIGVSAAIEGTGGFVVSGHVRNSDGTPVTSGTVTVTDVTNGSTVQVGLSALASDGSYSVSFQASAFTNNGAPHAQPNLQVTAVDGAGQLLAQSAIVVGAANSAVIDLTVAAPPQTGTSRVFGSITNSLGLPVAGILVQAFDVVWTTAGIQEISLGPAVTSDGGGNYQILYAPPVVPGSPTSCGPPTNQINLLVRASSQTTATPPVVTPLGASGIVANASNNQEVDLTVNSVAVSGTSEYTQLNNSLTNCLGSTDAIRFTTLNLINTRPDYLTFIAQTISEPEPLVLAYVRAWLIAGEINTKVGSPPLIRLVFPLSPEVIYGLVRLGLGTTLTDLISVMPDEFFASLVTAIHEGIISASIEANLRPSATGLHDSLLDDWKTVLSVMMTRTPGQGETVPFQQPLLAMVFPLAPVSPQVASLTPVPFGPQTTAHAVVMPTPLAAGDLLLVLFTNDGSATVTVPTGWTQLWSTATTSSTPIRFSGYAKVAVAADAGASVSFVTSAVEAAVAQVYRVAQASWSGISTAITDGVAVVATPATGSSTALNPPALTPPWGATLDLWIACAGHDLAIAQSGGAPTNYTGNTRTTSGSSPTTNSVTMLSAIRVNSAASEDPGNFNIATADDWVAQTVAVKPALAAPKRALVAAANFDNQGSFDALVTSLVAAGSLTALDGENLTFAFDLYHKVGGFFPIVEAVYADKVARGWHTTADLGTVTLNDTVSGGVTLKGWITYASISAGFNAGQFPGDVPGRSATEKAGVYGARLLALFGTVGQQNRFSSGLATAAAAAPPTSSLPEVSGFLGNPTNATFTLEDTNIDQYLAANPSASLSPAGVTALKQLQRVYRLTPDFTNGSLLIANQLDSAVKISQIDEGTFIAQIATQPGFVGGLTAARNIHRTAAHYTSEVLFTLVKFHQNLNDLGGVSAVPGKLDMTALADATGTTTLDPTEGYNPQLGVPTAPQTPSTRLLPNWITLFGSNTQCTCDCCQTVLDPGAYLVDLLEFVNGPAQNALFARRHDLADIEITCSNTNTELPYIDLVNEVLESAASARIFPLATTGGTITNVAAATLDGAAAGNAANLQTVIAAIAANGFVLQAGTTVKVDPSGNNPPYRAWLVSDGVWGFAVRGDSAPFAARATPPGLLAFQLTQANSNTPIPASTIDLAANGDAASVATISAAFAARGYILGPRATIARSNADAPQPPAAGAQREWFVDDDAWRYPIRDPGTPKGALFTVFPTPQTSATNDTLTVFPEHDVIDADNNLQNAVFPFNLPLAMGKEEGSIFLKAKGVRLSDVLEAFTTDSLATTFQKGTSALAYLNLVTAEANAIVAPAPLPAGSPPQVPPPAPIWELWGFDSQSPVLIPNPTTPTLNLQGSYLDLLALVPVFLQRSGLTYEQLLDLLDTQFVNLDVDFTAAPEGIHIAATGDALTQCDVTQFQIAHLNDPNFGPKTLGRISFFIRLWRRLGWSMLELDRYLMTVTDFPGFPVPQIPQNLIQVSQVQRTIDRLGIPAQAVFALWADVDTRRSVRNPKSLFDQVFLVGSPDQPELKDLETVAEGGSVTLPGTSSAPGEDIKAHVRAALRLTSIEIDFLWPDSVTSIDLAFLSVIYRNATLSQALGISVIDLNDLQVLTGQDPFDTAGTLFSARIPATFAALLEFARAQSTQMTPAAMTYYLTDVGKTGDPSVPSLADLETFAQRLSTSIAGIATSLPALAQPDAAALSKLLAKVVPAQRVVQAINIIAGPTPLSDADQAFLVRYFAPFLPTPSDPFFTTLFGTTDLPTRYAFVFSTLNAFLIDQAKTTDILVMAKELFAIDQDTADFLLTESLTAIVPNPNPTFPTPPDVTAMDDWKVFLNGGWDDGSATIDGAGPGVRRAVIVVPQSGQYQFFASIDGGTVVPGEVLLTTDAVKAVSIDTLTAVPATAAAPNTPATTLPFPSPVQLKANTVLNVRFAFQPADTTAKISLLWQIDNADAVPVPTTVTLPFTITVPTANPPAGPVAPPAYLKMAKAAGIATGLALTKLELRHLVAHQPPHATPNPLDLVFSFDGLPVLLNAPVVPWSALGAVIDLLALNRSTAFKNGTLFEFWNDVAAPSEADVENQTGWKAVDVDTILTQVTSLPAPVTTVPLDPARWFVLSAAMAIVTKLDLRAQQILDLLVHSELTPATAITLRNAFRAQFTADSWQAVFKPLRDPLRQKQRDALVGYLTTRPIWINGTVQTFIDTDDLFGFFLVDVGMETDTLISRMVLALNVIQLFVDRVFLGLEDGSSAAQLALLKDEWAWMDKFRVWQANRQVFLYPENYIEPELRDDKTELFQSLEDELQQQAITDDIGVTALTNYLDGMNEVSNLEIVGAYAEDVNSSGINYVLHVIGRTRSQPYTFYYRTFQGKQSYDGSWTPWITIPVDIDAELVAPVIFNGRLHLYWPMIRVKQVPQPTTAKIDGTNVATPQRTQYQGEIRLMWTEYNPSQNKWLKPKRTVQAAIDSNASNPFQPDTGDNVPSPDPYHLRISRVSPDYASVDVVKTSIPQDPTSPADEIIAAFARLFGATDPFPDTLNAQVLGTFQFWYTGEDTFDPTTAGGLSVGTNYPIGTVLKHNEAVEVEFPVEGEVAPNDELAFGDNVPFFGQTPGAFRVFDTNLDYFGAGGNRPFFYETDVKSLFAINRGPLAKAGLSQSQILTASFQAFNHPLVRDLQKRLHDFGAEGLMNRLTQALPIADSRYYSNYYYNYYGNLYLGYHIAGDTQAYGTTQRMFETEFSPGSDSVIPPYALPTIEFGYATPFGVYNWELFFHLPMLIAGRLSQDLQFEEAFKWYSYVFDPRQGLNTYEQTKSFVSKLPVGARFWSFLPFFANKDTTDSLLDTLGLRDNLSVYDRNQIDAEIDDWRRNPFKPDLIARQRMSAYQKFAFMKYLDNLIAWGDTLFQQDSFEFINEATQLYILANQLLGDPPPEVESLAEPQRLTFNELEAQGLDAFSDALVDVEYQIVSNKPYLPTTTLDPPTSGISAIKSLALKTPFFQIPRNDRLDTYWATVQDRLFKIHNSLNFEGVKRQLALFEPPINPALLVAATAAGLDLSSVISQLNTPLPHYRFTVWIQKAIDLCNELKSFGAEFLSALEKKDGEDLQLLRQTQEIRLLQLVRQVKQKQIDEANGNITALQLSLVMAEDRHTEYANREKISETELTEMALTTASTVTETLGGAAHALAALFAVIPDSTAGMVGPFPSGLVDIKIGTALQSAANATGDALGAAASLSRGLSSLAGMVSGFERRWEDWKLQERLALEEMNQINQQIAVANIRVDIAQTELDNQDAQIDMANDVLSFLKTKFTSKDLYSFMVTQLSRTFQQVYTLAYDAAKTAERTFQFELGVTDTYIQFGYQDSLHQGLLAGEKLIYDLKRMEVAYLDQYKREYEIQKPISLAMINGGALQTLRETGTCQFELPEILFDLDFPGQYFRRIKAVRLTIPCVTGPHTSVSAKLTLLGSTFRKDATLADPTKYPYQGASSSATDPRFVQDPVGIQAIAVGTAQNDPGLFELNFRDERYLPFEGAGAISRWQLDLPTAAPQFDYDTITDVVMTLSYTAREGGAILSAGATTNLTKQLDNMLAAISKPNNGIGLVRAFSLSKEFPDVFHRLLANTTSPTTMTLLPQHFPFVIRNKQMKMTIVSVATNIDLAAGAATDPQPTFTVNTSTDVPSPDGDISLATSPTGMKIFSKTTLGSSLANAAALLPGWTSQDLTLTQTGLTLDQVEDIVLIFTYTVS